MTELIIPVDLMAYCVGRLDAQGENAPVQKFAGVTTDYRNQTTTEHPAFLGVNVTRDPIHQPPLSSLECGVHLHWAMPDALTHASCGSGSLEFPPLPNRWLVTRIVAKGVIPSKHWIIESDRLSTSGKQWLPTVPVSASVGRNEAAQRDFRYLGAWQEFDNTWHEPTTDASELLNALSGNELHAVASGDIAFAAFYPNSRSVFGFYDNLTDLTDWPVELMYVVTGWYSTLSNDPLNGGVNLDLLQSKLGWTFKSMSDVSPNRSLYSGLTQGIQWSPDQKYVKDPDPVKGDIAIGNNPAEVLSAYFRGKKFPDVPLFEELMTLYAAGLLQGVTAPFPGQLAMLEETLHELQFSGFDGGSIYTISRGTAEDTDLPLPLADALNLLNAAQQTADSALVELQQARWQLFANWMRLFEADSSYLQAAFNAFSSQLNLQDNIQRYLQTAVDAVASQKSVVEKMLSSDLALIEVPAARFYTATEPVVMLVGDAATPALRHGGDGRYHPIGYLVCRLVTDVLEAISVDTSTLQASNYLTIAPNTQNLPSPAIASLIQEAALLNTAIASAVTGIAEEKLAKDLDLLITGEDSKLYKQPVGLPPSPVGITTWPGENPWCSLMLLWKATFHPLLDTSGLIDYQNFFFYKQLQSKP